MSTSEDFKARFDEEGLFRKGDGTLDVTFRTSGRTYRGKLHFANGFCVRAEMEGGGDWSNPDQTPLRQIRSELHFEGEKPFPVAIDEGRVFPWLDFANRDSRVEFLRHLRVARNLFEHSQARTASQSADESALDRSRARFAIWLTPKSLAGFNISLFPELGRKRRDLLQAAVDQFFEIARAVPADRSATEEQYRNGVVPFLRIIEILGQYLPLPQAEEVKKVEAAIQTVDFPLWIVNWDIELGNDSEGDPVVWVKVFLDDAEAPRQLPRNFSAELTDRIRQALTTFGINRWPHLRVWSATSYKSQA